MQIQKNWAMFISAGPTFVISRIDAQNGLYSIFKHSKVLKIKKVI
jgi:hypothetical protein